MRLSSRRRARFFRPRRSRLRAALTFGGWKFKNRSRGGFRVSRLARIAAGPALARYSRVFGLKNLGGRSRG